VPAPAVYHLNAIVASLAVTEIHTLVSPYKPLRRYLTYDELKGELMTVDVPPTSGCLHCSPEGLLGLGDLAPLWRPGERTTAPLALPSPVPMPASVGNGELDEEAVGDDLSELEDEDTPDDERELDPGEPPQSEPCRAVIIVGSDAADPIGKARKNTMTH